MFQQVTPSVNWCAMTEPETMVQVGPDAVGILCKHIVVFYNLKNDTKNYFKGDNGQTGGGISLLTGHSRFPLFAVVEAKLMPNIFIMRYPDMEKLTTIFCPDIMYYVDIAFSDFGFITALGCHPSYRLCVWNYKTAEMYTFNRTFKKSSRYSLVCHKMDVEVVIQYSVWHKQILVWHLCHAADADVLHEVSTIDLSKDFSLSNYFPLLLYDDGYAYVVNDYGEIFWVDVSCLTIRLSWSAPHTKPRRHSLFYHKTGLIILNNENILLLKRRSGESSDFAIEWSVETPSDSIIKVISDPFNNVYGVADYGNIYSIRSTENATSIVPVTTNNCNVLDYALLKGNKDEVVLLLTATGEVRVVDMIKMNTYSSMQIDGGIIFTPHNSLPYVAVGTRSGWIYFLNYEKVRSPYQVGELFLEEVKLDLIRLYDSVTLVVDCNQCLHVSDTDLRAGKFHHRYSLKSEPKNRLDIVGLFLLDERRALVFLNKSSDPLVRYSTEAWLYQWNRNDNRVQCSVFELPYKYRDITVIMPCKEEEVEIICIRLAENIIDIYILAQSKRLNIITSFQTIHLTHMCRTSGSRNVLTADTLSVVIHFRTHKKSKVTFGISRPLLCTFMPRVNLKMDECFNGKYLLMLYYGGYLISYRLPILVDNVRENKPIPITVTNSIVPLATTIKELKSTKVMIAAEVTDKDLLARDGVLQELRSLEQVMRELIDYDMAVAGYNRSGFRKFCLNHTWLATLGEESRVLCEHERLVLLAAIADQSRIRDWISDLIKVKHSVFSTKLRSLFSNIYVQSYSTSSTPNELLNRFDLFRFYNMEPLEDDEVANVKDDEDHEDLGEEEEAVEEKPLKRYIIEKGMSVFDHVMAKAFELQDVNIVTFNQVYNEDAKYAIILVEALKHEFNKKFASSKSYKLEIMDNVLGTNATLQKIYSNMNCMLCLLQMEQFVPPTLSVPEWTTDESIARILTVDDSEIKAINRRKKAVIAAAHKSGRMLLWSPEFWARALIFMMDGVLEKLWEEEIKKTPLPPEFTFKKQAHEYNLEEQRLIREYENRLRLLEEDRKKYLRILRDNDVKTQNLKKYFVTKINEHIAEMDILKLKYDFAIKHERLRVLNMKLTQFQRIDCRRRIEILKTQIEKFVAYTSKYETLLEFFERNQAEFKINYDGAVSRDRQLERQFKGLYLNGIPQHLTQDMAKLYRKRPKLPNKVFNSAAVCNEVAHRVLAKKAVKFPLSQELLDFLKLLKTLDSVDNCPTQLDAKLWENFTRLRRQKIESELRVKAIGYQVSLVPKNIAFFVEEVRKMKEARNEANIKLTITMEEYFDVVQNQRLEFILSKGQVEVHVGSGCLDVLNNCLLMHVDDIDQVNSLIKEAGRKKIKSMQRVALFRRQVIFKEWEHKVERANIRYLEYILELVENCKVNYEFLEVLRNWKKVKDNRESSNRVGLIEDVILQRVKAARKNLDRLQQRIDEVRQQVEEKRIENLQLNAHIDNAKVGVTYLNVQRDFMGEEKMQRWENSRMGKAAKFGTLSTIVRQDFAKILELKTLLDIQRLRTLANLPPEKEECPGLETGKRC